MSAYLLSCCSVTKKMTHVVRVFWMLLGFIAGRPCLSAPPYMAHESTLGASAKMEVSTF